MPPDATIGVTYAVAAAAGILLICEGAHRRGARHLPSGNILGITRADTLVLIAIAVPVLLVHVGLLQGVSVRLVRPRDGANARLQRQLLESVALLDSRPRHRVRDAVRRRDARLQFPGAPGCHRPADLARAWAVTFFWSVALGAGGGGSSDSRCRSRFDLPIRPCHHRRVGASGLMAFLVRLAQRR